MQHYRTIHLLIVAVLLLAAAGVQASGQGPSYVVTRPEFDYTITEVPGLNYVCVDRLPVNVPVARSFPGLMLNSTPTEPDRVWLSIVGDMFWGTYMKKLREAGVEYLYAFFDKDQGTPTIRLGVYRPDNEIIRIIVGLVDEAADEVERLIRSSFADPSNVEDALEALQALRAVRIQITEVYAHAGMAEKLEAEAIQLREALINGTLKPPLGLGCCVWETAGGWIYVDAIYEEGEPPRELLVEVFREIRRVVDPDLAVVLVVWSSYPWKPLIPVLPIPADQTTITTATTTTPSQTKTSGVKVMVEVRSTVPVLQNTTTLTQSTSTTGATSSGGGEAQAKWLTVAVAATLILLAAAWLRRG